MHFCRLLTMHRLFYLMYLSVKVYNAPLKMSTLPLPEREKEGLYGIEGWSLFFTTGVYVVVIQLVHGH